MPQPEPDAPQLARGPAIVTIILTLASWTTIPLFLRHFKDHIDGWTANGWRYGLSALLWVPAILWAWSRDRWPDRLWQRALMPSLFNAIAQVMFGLAPYYIKPGLMTFSLRLQIVFVTIGAALLFAAERRVIRRPTFILGLLCVILGTSGTLLFKDEGLGSGTGVGVALAIGSGLLYAGYALSVRSLLAGVNPFIAFAAVSQYTALILLALMFAFAHDRPPIEGVVQGTRDLGASALNLPTIEFIKLLASAIIGIGIGHTLYYFSISRLGLAVSAGVVQLQPVTVSIASLFLFDERLNSAQWISGLGAIAGAGLILFTQQRMAKHR
jgi:drug/metabolite transporter (DMT)-like permease